PAPGVPRRPPPSEPPPPFRCLFADWDGPAHLELPDPASERSKIPFGPAALDGVRLHHMRWEPSGTIDAAALLRVALQLVSDSSDDARSAFYAASLACDPIAIADDLVRALVEQPTEVKA